MFLIKETTEIYGGKTAVSYTDPGVMGANASTAAQGASKTATGGTKDKQNTFSKQDKKQVVINNNYYTQVNYFNFCFI
jgi:hypothetical protein